VGGRRVGKTSLLKELEYRVQLSTQTPWAPLYWDLEGSGDARGLAEGLLGSVEDSESFRRATRVSVEEFEGLSVADLLMALTRRTVRSGWRLLLLIDEAEELLTVAQEDLAVLPRLRRIFQRGSDVRAVLTSTRRLARLDQAADIATSPFLQGFAPPLYLTPLAPEEARALLARGGFEREDVELILARSACHPFLLQLIASRLFETPDVRAVLEQVAADEMVANFFAVDFQTLEAPERALLEELSREGEGDAAELGRVTRLSGDALETHLQGLRQMGYLAHEKDRYSIANSFFERWLRRAGTLRSEASSAP
jgi:hypothetical protein